MTMTFSHFSDAETIEPYNVEQDNERFKPRGLWVSVDGDTDWPEWARDNGYDIAPNQFRVEIAEGPLVLAEPDAVVAFGREFGRVRPLDCPGRELIDHIDWQRVAQRWPGIVIAPYQWSLRMPLETSWYYPWDCASGCIWDASVITSVERVTEAVCQS